MPVNEPRGSRVPAVKSGARSVLVGLGLCALPWLLAAPSSAQTLTGRVLDGATDEPLADATLVLLHPDGHAVGDTVGSGPDGAFTIDVPEPGPHYIQVELIGYTSIVDGILDFTSADASMEITVYLLAKPIEVEGVEVEVDREQTRRHLRAAGFYQRATDSYGDFVTPEQIERRGGVAGVSDLMRHISGITTMESLVLFRATGPPPKPNHASSECPGCPGGSGVNGTLILMNDDGTYESLDACEPAVWIDGSKMQTANTDGRLQDGDFSQGLDAYVSPEDVAAIEVYRGIAGTPFEWGGMNNACGAIVIWTKKSG